MADPPKYPADVPHASAITASNGSSVISPQVIDCHIEGPVSNNINVYICGERETSSPTSPTSDPERLQLVQAEFKENLRQKLETILEAIAKRSNMTLLEWIHPNLYISEEQSNGLFTENEIWRIDKDKAISCNDLFKELPDQKVVLTTGIAGTGKTVCVQKFVLDWAMGTANQDVDFMFVLPFSELNLLTDDEHSLHSLLCHFHPELKVLDPKVYEQCKVVFIFDGLNESKLDLDLKSRSEVDSNTEEETVTSVDTLISDLIKGELATSALIWITSRPAEANQLQCRPTDLVTDLQGFSDAQIEEYFKKKICGCDKANRIISHIRATWTLHTMCHLPVFCWITATALERVYDDCKSDDLPKTLTEVLTCYLMQRNQTLKTGRLSEADVELFNALGEMAFKHPRDNSVLTEDDFREHGIESGDEAMQSELLAHILEVSPNSSPSKTYRFLHSSIQAYLAALSVLRSYSSYSITVLKPGIPWFPKQEATSDSESSEYEDQETWARKQHQGTLWELLQVAVDNSLVNVKLQLNKSSDRHLKHFLPFLLGLAFNCGQMLLAQLIGDNKQDQDSIQQAIIYIKRLLKTKKKQLNHDQSINLLRCLAELKDYSFEKEMRMFMSSCGSAEGRLSIAQCSVLAHLVQVSGTVLDDLDVLRMCSSSHGQWKLVSVVRNCRKACIRPWQAIAVVSALFSTNSHLEKLEFSHGMIVDCKRLIEAIKAPVFKLKELHFTHIERCISRDSSDLPLWCMAEQEFWVELIHTTLLGQHGQPHSFTLKDCNLSDGSCEILALALQSTNSGLKELDLSYNNLTDTGVQNIYQKLEHSKCDLEKLSLSYCCEITEKSCATLAKVLHRSCLRELHLDGCRFGDSGIKLLSRGMTRPNQLQILWLGHCGLTGDSCEALVSALSSDSSALKQLDLSNNDLQDSGVKLLCVGLKSSHCKLEILRMSGCMITEEGCSSLASALTSNPSHLRELDLSYNHPGESGEKVLSARLEDPHCKLETLNLKNCGEHRMKPGIRKYGSYFAKWELSCEDDVQKWEGHLVDSGFCGEQGKFYWQVEWTSEIDFGMKYKSVNGCYTFDQNRSEIPLRIDPKKPYMVVDLYAPALPQTVGIYLDWPAGTLSFYRILSDQVQKPIPKSDQLTHLYTFHHRFRKPLYPYVKLQKTSAMVSVQSLEPFSPN
ncbi:NACHT, LRR and PYD domains-containing protein 12-like isoform X4 [Colossoma macropomum]|uniref:NACHT, LRR and PYD domains-containing protein 12-like isoform X4 n=1 Tax=Colossoma macropomum TaxID=42526 RepID=UPI0018647E1E|nr:NACHT, LRR and PYD domains-containing protein 12-like isoform X4 [Colossoma macropomum]